MARFGRDEVFGRLRFTVGTAITQVISAALLVLTGGGDSQYFVFFLVPTLATTFAMRLSGTIAVGVVALNVAVLTANMAVHRLDGERAQLQAQNQALSSQLSAANAAPRIEAAAHRLGLVQAPAADMIYLDLSRP